MAIKKEKHLYEILIRMGPGGFQGAHVKDLQRVKDSVSGEVYAEKELDPRPITLAEVGTLLGAENAQLLERIGKLDDELAVTRADRDAAEKDRTQARVERDALRAERDALRAAKVQ